MNDKALTITGGDFLTPVAAVDQVLAAYQLKKEIVEKVLRRGVDYGTIPGGTKDALFKPGAEKFSNMYGLTPVFEDVQIVEDWTGADHDGEPFFYYRQKCKLYKGDALMGTADGSCNSWEVKYRYRTQERTCPGCGVGAIKKSKFPPRDNPQADPGWYCHAKVGGCGANYPAGDQSIEDQQLGRIPNPDVSELVNTILKMAQKRALVAAVLIVTGASDYFTQDIEDFIEGTFTASVQPEPDNKPTAPKQSKPKNGNGAPETEVASAPQALVDAKVCKDLAGAAGLLSHHVPNEIRSDPKAAVAWGKLYRGWRDSGLEPNEAAEKATAGEQPK